MGWLGVACGPGEGPPTGLDASSPYEGVAEVLERRCGVERCHAGSVVGGGLYLGPGADYHAALVNVPAVLEDYMRVLPGDADASYLVIKVEGMQMAGQQMPIDSIPLDDIDRSNIRNWIGNGAPNN